MKVNIIYIITLFVWWFCGIAAAGDYVVERRYYDDGLLKDFGANIILRGTPEQVLKFTRWLDQIAMVPKGYRTLMMISNTPHELLIQHADHAVYSAGRTIAPMTMNLINGLGESVHIIFDTRSGDRGSHMVYNAKHELIEYTAVQNLYHELAHAMHQMNGTWRYFDSEAQAIEEENIFRKELAAIRGMSPTQRYRVSGIMICNVDNPPVSKPTSR